MQFHNEFLKFCCSRGKLDGEMNPLLDGSCRLVGQRKGKLANEKMDQIYMNWSTVL